MDLPSLIAQNLDPVCYPLVLNNNLDELDVLSDWFNQISQQLQFSERVTFQLELALSEAVTNVINYAYEDDSEHQIALNLRSAGNTIQVELKDDGRPFDPLQHPPVTPPTTIEEAQVGGLGIHLIRSYMDECHYVREGQYNILTLIIHDTV